MSAGPVLAASPWRTNAELIADCARLGYLAADWLTLDPTYGRGIWWKAWRPDRLVTSDVRPGADHLADFRDLPFPDDTFDAVAYDPPYVSVGGRTTSTLPPVLARPGPVDNSRGVHRRTSEGADFLDRYGLIEAAKRPAEVQQTINDGLTEAWRVARPSGIVLVKCQDYITSGKFFAGTHKTLTHALDRLGFELVDRLEHLGGVRPQPARVRQVHARRNLSTLFVLRKPRRAFEYQRGEG